jgi:hypothetical protein
MGSYFSELESAQNLPWTLEIAFLKYFEDSEIYDIPVKIVTLHNSDFVNRMQLTKLTNSPFGHSGTKITWLVWNTFLIQKKKYSPFLSQKDKG